MVLESLNEPQIDITSLSIQESAPQTPELKFNPDTEFVETDWLYLDLILKDVSETNMPSQASVVRVMQIYLLSPERVMQRIQQNGLYEKLPSIISDMQVVTASKFPTAEYVVSYLSLSVARKVLFGTAAGPEPFAQEAFEAAMEILIQQRASVKWADYHDTISLTVMAFPQKRDGMGIDETLKRRMLDMLQFLPATAKYSKVFGEASRIAILFPEANVKQYFSNQQWDEAKRELGEYRNEDISVTSTKFIQLALAMKIVAAEEVKFGENGLEIIMSKTHFDPTGTEKMPERRDF
jgi:hypothetical protein